MSDKQKQKRGFTLVELLVVIAIIGNLSVIAIINLNDARALARDAVRIHDLNTFSKGLELYLSEHGFYPCGNGSYADSNNLDGDGNSDLATLDTTFSCSADINEVNNSGFLNGPGTDGQYPANCSTISGHSDSFGLFKDNILYSNCPKDPKNSHISLDPNYGYMYTVSHDRLSYTLSTYLERNVARMANDGGVCSRNYEIRGGDKKNDQRSAVIRIGTGCN